MTTSSLLAHAALVPSVLLLTFLSACGGATITPLGDAGGPPSTKDDTADDGGSQTALLGSGTGVSASNPGPTSGSVEVDDAGDSVTTNGLGSGGSTTVTPTTGEYDDGGSSSSCGPVYCEPDGGPCAGTCAASDASLSDCMSYCAPGSCGMSDGCFGICGCAPGETCSADGTCS
jgi:hypothetical protein